MESSDWVAALVMMTTLFCMTFLIGKGCDYEHMETMKRIETNQVYPQASPRPSP